MQINSHKKKWAEKKVNEQSRGFYDLIPLRARARSGECHTVTYVDEQNLATRNELYVYILTACRFAFLSFSTCALRAMIPARTGEPQYLGHQARQDNRILIHFLLTLHWLDLTQQNGYVNIFTKRTCPQWICIGMLWVNSAGQWYRVFRTEIAKSHCGLTTAVICIWSVRTFRWSLNHLDIHLAKKYIHFARRMKA